MIRKLIAGSVIFYLLAIVSCGNNGYTVEGVISGNCFNGDTIYLKHYSGDSLSEAGFTEIRDCEFEFNGAIEKPSLAALYLNETFLMPLVLENGTVSIVVGDETVRANGTELNEALYAYIDEVDEYSIAVSEISRMEARLIMDGSVPATAKEQAEKQLRSVDEEMRRYVCAFIRTHYCDVLGPLAFRQWFGHMRYPMSDENVRKLVDEAPDVFKESHEVRSIISLDAEGNSSGS